MTDTPRVLYSGPDGFAILMDDAKPYQMQVDAEVLPHIPDDLVEQACRVWYDSTLSPGQYRWNQLKAKDDWRLEAWRAQIRAVVTYLAAQDHEAEKRTRLVLGRLVQACEMALADIENHGGPMTTYVALEKAIKEAKELEL